MAIGIDLGGTNIKAGLCDIHGRIIKTLVVPSPVKDGSRVIIEAMVDAAHELMKFASEKGFSVVAAGAGSPGIIDVNRGIVLGNTPNIPDWGGVRLRDEIASELSLPCAVDNDANMFMLAESLFGAARGYRNAVGLTLGTGIGGAILMDGKIYRGSGFSAGEIGHMPIVANGRKCKCGLRGCLEAYASAPALVREYKRLSKINDRKIDSERIFELARKKDKIASQAVDIWCGYLSTGIASVVNVLNPDVVILGGGVAGGGEYLRNIVTTSVKEKVLREAREGLEIKIAELGNNAGWLGAAAYALNSIDAI